MTDDSVPSTVAKAVGVASTGRIIARAIVVSYVLTALGCGGDSAGGESTSDWAERHDEAVAALGQELIAADAALDQGDRRLILGTCNLLNDAVAAMRDQALPVPDPEVNERLSEAVADITLAVESCLEGGRSGAAADVEAAMALMSDAEESFERAQAALRASS